MAEIPQVPWRTIVADPPWPYSSRGLHGAMKNQMVKDGSRMQVSVGQWTYDPMELTEILALPVSPAPNAHLYLWTTNAFMVEAHQVAEAWGFSPKTILTWVKTRHDDPSKASMKSGYYFRGATEHVVFAVRGSQPLLTNDAIPTALLLPRIARHSEKPQAFFDLVRRVSPGPRISLFERHRRPGFKSWGDQMEGSDA